MFTGIVRSQGVLQSVQTALAGGCTLRILMGDMEDDQYFMSDGMGGTESIHRGDSIAVNGVCLTIADLADGLVMFDVSPETQACCLIGGWRVGEQVNIEPALTMQTRLGGHFMSGHVDCIGVVVDYASDGRFVRMEIEAPCAIGKLIARKGAVAVDGVSLTSNEVTDVDGQTRFSVMLVPHTLQTTTLGRIAPRARVHLEVDPLARYVQRLIEFEGVEIWPARHNH